MEQVKVKVDQPMYRLIHHARVSVQSGGGLAHVRRKAKPATRNKNEVLIHRGKEAKQVSIDHDKEVSQHESMIQGVPADHGRTTCRHPRSPAVITLHEPRHDGVVGRAVQARLNLEPLRR